MMGILGQKRGMTQIFDSSGNRIPVTIVSSESCFVIGKRTLEKDGYNALILGYGDRKVKKRPEGDDRLPKPMPVIGQFVKAGLKPMKFIREIRVDEETLNKFKVRDEINVSIFKEGETVDVTGISKGRGFAGVVKRWNFKCAPASRGTHEYFRHGGSIGTNMTPGRTFKGKKMAGHMGCEKVTIQNLKIVRVDEDQRLIFLKGGVPGPNRGLLIIRNAKKSTSS